MIKSYQRNVISFFRGYFSLLLLLELPSSFSNNIVSYDNCPTNSIPDTTPVSSIADDALVKVCTGMNYDDVEVEQKQALLNKPMCGNGEEFNFFVMKPEAEYANNANIVIEFQGGGACWSGESCSDRADLLEFPTDSYDLLVGYGCNAIKSLLNLFGLEVNALCNDEIGKKLKLNEYNFLVMPYCTQDMHIGDSIVEYVEDGAANRTVYHHGAHNTMAMLNYVFDNFPNAENIVLTGCSAGANALGYAYDLIRQHYDNDKVRIDVLMDSLTILSTEEFQRDYFQNWGLDTISSLTTFDYDAFKESKDFSLYHLLHILEEISLSDDGKSCDRFGAIQHSKDPVALMYWGLMGGGTGYDEWWEEQSFVFDQLKATGVFETFVIEDDEAHCSFGLYYALKKDGFGDFVDRVVQTECSMNSTTNVSAFSPTENPYSFPSSAPTITQTDPTLKRGPR